MPETVVDRIRRTGVSKIEISTDGGSSWTVLAERDIGREDFDAPNEEGETVENMDGRLYPTWLRAPFTFLVRSALKQAVQDLRDARNNFNEVHFRFHSANEQVITDVPNTNQPGIVPEVEHGLIQEPGSTTWARITAEASGPTHTYVMSSVVYN